MTRNPKPDELPADLNRMIDRDGRVRPTAPLIIDYYLSREGVIKRIAETARMELASTHLFEHEDLVRLTILLVDDFDGDPAAIRATTPKYDLIDRIGDEIGFDVHREQSKLIKSQLIHVLLTLTADTPPDRFQVPCDPEIEQLQPNTRVPALD